MLHFITQESIKEFEITVLHINIHIHSYAHNHLGFCALSYAINLYSVQEPITKLSHTKLIQR